MESHTAQLKQTLFLVTGSNLSSHHYPSWHKFHFYNLGAIALSLPATPSTLSYSTIKPGPRYDQQKKTKTIRPRLPMKIRDSRSNALQLAADADPRASSLYAPTH